MYGGHVQSVWGIGVGIKLLIRENTKDFRVKIVWRNTMKIAKGGKEDEKVGKIAHINSKGKMS